MAADAVHLRPDVDVQLGCDVPQNNETAIAAAALINAAYGYRRVSPSEMAHRLRTGRNRALHVAMLDGKVVGCCSSTLHVPWCGPGCGHWGLLAVLPDAQRMGVASALVAHAEQRLAHSGLSKVQIEYRYDRGKPDCERLFDWYEGSLGFVGPKSRKSGFRSACERSHQTCTQPRLMMMPLPWYIMLTWSLAALPSLPHHLFAVCRKRLEPSGTLRYICCEWFYAILLWLCMGQY